MNCKDYHSVKIETAKKENNINYLSGTDERSPAIIFLIDDVRTN